MVGCAQSSVRRTAAGLVGGTGQAVNVLTLPPERSQQCRLSARR